MKYIDLLNIDNGLGKIVDKEITGASVGFFHALVHNRKELVKHLEVFSETRQSIIGEGEVDEETSKKIEELLLTEVETNFKLFDMEDISKVQGITFEVLVLLGNLINEETSLEA